MMTITTTLMVLLCFGLFDNTKSAPTPIVKERNEQNEYNLHFKLKSGHLLNEKLNIDTNAKTEYFSVPKHGDKEEIEVMQDFLTKRTMIHVKSKNVCYISKMTSGTPPDVLKKTLEKNDIPKLNGLVLKERTTWKIDKVFTQRYLLSEEIAIMCARSSIYWLQKVEETGSRQSRDTEHSRVRRSACSSNKYCLYEVELRMVEIDGKWVLTQVQVKKCRIVLSC